MEKGLKMLFFFNKKPEDVDVKYCYSHSELNDLGLVDDVIDFYKQRYGAEYLSHYLYDKHFDSLEFYDLSNPEEVGLEDEEDENGDWY